MQHEQLLTYIQTSIISEPITTTLIILIMFLIPYTLHLSMRITRLTQGNNGKSLETVIHALNNRTSTLEAYARKNQVIVENIDTRTRRALQGVALERFDPFKQQGGQQSFSAALVNERGDGIIISGIHSRDHMRVYAKPVTQFVSEYELSEEEVRALMRCKKDLNQ